jgi:Kef-type K+ transport system membrane component KefB
MDFLVDTLCFLVAPVLCWRVIRGAAPMAVLPILAGLGVAVAAAHFGFDKSVIGPSPLGEQLGWIGVLVLAFSAGLETRTMASGPKLGPQLFASAIGALALPFAVGFLLAFSGAIDGVIARPANVQPWLSSAAIGLCLAVSALPVLVGIVRELPAPDRPLGNLALRIAALDDAILWIGLAVLLFLHAGANGAVIADWRDFAAIGLFVAMIALRKPLERWLPDHPAVTIALGAAYLFGGSWATTTLGLHELLGAYFAGALAPANFAARLKPELIGKIALFGLSPFFFAHRGLAIDGSVLTPAALGVAFVFLLLAVSAKFLAVHLTPPDASMPPKEKTRLALLLQCKGLMEIVAASILLQAGLLSPTAFAILVTLAIVSTTLTAPLFRWASRETAVATAKAGTNGSAR